jgi:hypothetical protein
MSTIALKGDQYYYNSNDVLGQGSFATVFLGTKVATKE